MFLTPAEDAISGITNSEIPDDVLKDLSPTETHKKVKPVKFPKPHATEPSTTGKVFDEVERRPEFPGGMAAFYRFISETIKYPAAMRVNNVQGKAYISFIIEKDGAVTDVKSLKDPGYGSGEEAVRTIALSPRWIPGLQNGQPIRVKYTVPINFSLAGDEQKPIIRSGADTTRNAVKQPTTEPLVLVDGTEYNDNIKNIATDKIQKIEIIKDKSATAYVPVYGNKALNGVILITLKK